MTTREQTRDSRGGNMGEADAKWGKVNLGNQIRLSDMDSVEVKVSAILRCLFAGCQTAGTTKTRPYSLPLIHKCLGFFFYFIYRFFSIRLFNNWISMLGINKGSSYLKHQSTLPHTQKRHLVQNCIYTVCIHTQTHTHIKTYTYLHISVHIFKYKEYTFLNRKTGSSTMSHEYRALIPAKLSWVIKASPIPSPNAKGS